MGKGSEEGALVDAFGDVGHGEEGNGACSLSGDGEQVGVESIESEFAEGEGEVNVWGPRGHFPDETKEVDRPEVKIAERLPEHREGNSLAIVHVTFAGIVAEDSVGHDCFFSFVEPAVLSEPGFGLGW